MLIMARRNPSLKRKRLRKEDALKGSKAQGKGNLILAASSLLMLLGIALAAFGYLSYHNAALSTGIGIIIISLWWIALRSSGRSPFAVRS